MRDQEISIRTIKALNNLMELCLKTSRAGDEVKNMQAYKNAELLKTDLVSFLEVATKMGLPRRAVAKADEAAESVPVVVVVDAGNTKQDSSASHCAVSIIDKFADGNLRNAVQINISYDRLASKWDKLAGKEVA